MYICLGNSDGEYKVVDTSDGVIEYFDKAGISKYVDAGYEIYGLTSESLGIDVRATVLVDFKDKREGVGRMFNGYYFLDYDNETYGEFGNRYLYHVIPETELGRSLVWYLQEANSYIHDRAVANYRLGKVGFEMSCDAGVGLFNAVDLASGIEYCFDYCCAVYFLSEKGVIVRGMEPPGTDSVWVCGREFRLSDALDAAFSEEAEETDARYSIAGKIQGSQYVESLYVRSSNVDSFVRCIGGIPVSQSRFPAVSLMSCRRDSPFSQDIVPVLELMSEVQCGEYLGREGHTLRFRSGDVEVSAISDYLDVFSRSCSCYDDLQWFKPMIAARNKILTGEEGYKGHKQYRVDGTYIRNGKEPYESVRGVIDQDKFVYVVPTDFGGIATRTYIRSDDMKRIGGMYAYTIKGMKPCYYNIGRSGLTVVINKQNVFPKFQSPFIQVDGFARHVDRFRDSLGYYCDRPLIMPLFIHSIFRYQDGGGVGVNVLVAVNTNNYKAFDISGDYNSGFGACFLVVPLLLTGTRHCVVGEFVLFEMLFQDVVMTKELYANLVADVNLHNDLISIDTCSEKQTSNICNCDVGNASTRTACAIKEETIYLMKDFNRGIQDKGYFE